MTLSSIRGGYLPSKQIQQDRLRKENYLSLSKQQDQSVRRTEMNEESLDGYQGGKSGEQTVKDFASMTISSILTHFQLTPTHSNEGYDSSQVPELLKSYGSNSLAEPPGKNLLALIAEQFEDGLVQILLGVALLSGLFSLMEYREEGNTQGSLLKAFVEPLVIGSILALNAVVGVWQSKSAEDSLEALQKMQPTLATVLRNGSWFSDVDASTLVPGDVIQIRVGDQVPADCRLLSLQTSGMSVDEGSLTGESITVQKLPGDDGTCADVDMPIQYQHGMLFSGTMVTSGAGTALVVRTGMETEFGKIQKGVISAQSTATKTPLTLQIDEFAHTLTILISIVCLTVFVASIPKFSDPSFPNVWAGMIYYAKVSVALGVAAIPEGLPAVITLCLSLGTRRMAQKNVIVRKLPSVETLGSCNVICTDKTGTLTLNEMTARSLLLIEGSKNKNEYKVAEYEVHGLSYSPIGWVESVTEVDPVVADIISVAALCNDAHIVSEIKSDTDSHTRQHASSKGNSVSYSRVGEPTEAALCTLVEKLCKSSKWNEKDDGAVNTAEYPYVMGNQYVKQLRVDYPRLATLEFSRDRKSMSVLSHSPQTKRNRLLVKGAPNLLIERCTKVKLRSGDIVPLTPRLKTIIMERNSELASRPLRCLALAIREHDELPSTLQAVGEGNENNVYAINMRDHPLLKDPNTYEKIESDMTLVGIVGMMDPARPEVAQSMQRCKRAGIRIIMITGDAKDTAIAIARDVNIFPSKISSEFGTTQELAFEGREFFAMSLEAQLEILSQPSNVIFCRAQPSDKQKLVSLLQSLNYIPAMTGDGVNDAPALQQAAIGIAMGITGTAVSKSAADMIITNDDFSTIVDAVEEGRTIYANMQAFINFLISCNIGEVFCILLSTVLGVPEPLSAMHLLWVNLVTDGPPATALGFNPPSDDLMARKPRKSDEPLMTRWLLTRYTITGLYVGLATVGIFVSYYMSEGITLSQLSSWSKCGTLWQPTSLYTHKSCEALFQGEGRQLPQTLSLTALVCMEMFKALAAVSVDNSILKVPPTRNPYLILGVAFPFILHLSLVYSRHLGFPTLGESFGMVPLSWNNWLSVLCWSTPILVLDEILKFVGRKLAKTKAEQENQNGHLSHTLSEKR